MEKPKNRNAAGTVVVLVLLGFALLVAGGRWFVKWLSTKHPVTTVPSTR
jgi:hypothetical protein